MSKVVLILVLVSQALALPFNHYDSPIVPKPRSEEISNYLFHYPNPQIAKTKFQDIISDLQTENMCPCFQNIIKHKSSKWPGLNYMHLKSPEVYYPGFPSLNDLSLDSQTSRMLQEDITRYQQHLSSRSWWTELKKWFRPHYLPDKDDKLVDPDMFMVLLQ